MAERHARAVVANNRQGWGVAALVSLLALACALGAWTINKRTYVHPRSPINTLQQAAPQH